MAGLEWPGAADGAADAQNGQPYYGSSPDLGAVLSAISLWGLEVLNIGDVARRLWSHWVPAYEEAVRRHLPGHQDITANQLRDYVQASWRENLGTGPRDALLEGISRHATGYRHR